MSKKHASYVMRARRERLIETRRRIVEATVALHEELGPRCTTISAIAKRAGVERLTVYRHFPNERAIYRACAGCWFERNPLPAPAAWGAVIPPAERTRKALHLLYSYYSRTQRMLRRVLHDAEDTPSVAEAAEDLTTYTRGIADDLLASWDLPPARRDELRALLRHAVRFSTWTSLETEGVSNVAKARLIVAWADAVSAGAASIARSGGIGRFAARESDLRLRPRLRRNSNRG